MGARKIRGRVCHPGDIRVGVPNAAGSALVPVLVLVEVLVQSTNVDHCHRY